MSDAWRLLERAGDPETLVRQLPDHGGRRLVCICRPAAAALVLGSAQRPDVVDVGRLRDVGTSVVRRRSGGGAVFVAPGDQIWVDAFLPAGDPLLVADVGRTAWWLGELWAAALATVTRAEAGTSSEAGTGTGSGSADRAGGAPAGGAFTVHRGGLVPSRWSTIVCFAGLGPGEVTSRGRKVVGISQQRDRSGAWLHSMALTRIDPSALAALFVLSPRDRASMAEELSCAVGVVSAPEDRLVAALRAGFV